MWRMRRISVWVVTALLVILTPLAAGKADAEVVDSEGVTIYLPDDYAKIQRVVDNTSTVSYDLSYRDFSHRKWVCTFDDNWCGYAEYWPKAVIYGWMETNIKVPGGADKLKVTIQVCSRGWGEGLAVDYGLWTNNSGIQIIVDDKVWYNKINESTIKSKHHHSYYKHDYGERFSTDLFNVSGKNNITLTIKMIDGARLDFCNASLTFYITEIPPNVIFDTGKPSDPYPSISGTFNGTIEPKRTIIATKLHTYPCEGTGGHAQYAKIWNSTWEAVAEWNGYKGDWKNITFNKPVVLLPNETYNITIITGSYPMIHHTSSLKTENGWINCTEFVDVNNRRYNNWIPAIKLY